MFDVLVKSANNYSLIFFDDFYQKMDFFIAVKYFVFTPMFWAVYFSEYFFPNRTKSKFSDPKFMFRTKIFVSNIKKDTSLRNFVTLGMREPYDKLKFVTNEHYVNPNE